MDLLQRFGKLAASIVLSLSLLLGASSFIINLVLLRAERMHSIVLRSLSMYLSKMVFICRARPSSSPLWAVMWQEINCSLET